MFARFFRVATLARQGLHHWQRGLHPLEDWATGNMSLELIPVVLVHSSDSTLHQQWESRVWRSVVIVQIRKAYGSLWNMDQMLLSQDTALISLISRYPGVLP